MGGPARSWVSVICETVQFHYLFSGGGGVTRKRYTVCSSAAISTGLDRCASMPASFALFHILKEGVCGQRLRPVRTGSCVDSPIKVVTLYSSILLKPFQAYFEFLAIIQMRLNL